MADRYAHARALFGDDVLQKMHDAKVLVVGAGGIGCELVKNLVLTGFLHLELIDLDTIDVSNLNRQFLFRQRHVGQSKAKVAEEAARKFNPDVEIRSHHGDIKDPRFGASYFQQFDLVFNALDNLGARMHVNRMCLSCGVALIESGTSGYLGQVQTIKKGVTECYECRPKPTPKQPPVCTIRNNPSTMVHCVFWAKFLFGLLFGEKDANNALNEEEGEQLPTTTNGVFTKFFGEDVKTLARMDDLWKNRAPPQPLDLASLAPSFETHSAEAASFVEQLPDHVVWTTEQSAKCFTQRCAELLRTHRGGEDGVCNLVFDKDMPEAMDFVTAAANLRAQCFHIDPKSRFDVKEIAGNIIPAIATTNAIVAGLMVTEAVKALKGNFDESRFIYCNRHQSGKLLLVPVPHAPPNPKCYVCSSTRLELHVDTHKRSLQFVVDTVLKQHLSMVDPMVTRTDEKGASLIYEEGNDLDEDEVAQYSALAAKSLDCLNVTNRILSCESLQQHLTVEIAVIHRAEGEDEGAAGAFELLSDGQQAQAGLARSHTNGTGPGKGEGGGEGEGGEGDDADGVVVVNKNKRKRESNPSSEPAAKRVAKDDVVAID